MYCCIFSYSDVYQEIIFIKVYKNVVGNVSESRVRVATNLTKRADLLGILGSVGYTRGEKKGRGIDSENALPCLRRHK